MRTLLFIVVLTVGVPAAAAGGWILLNNTSPGLVGTPAHAGVVSNGKPEDCTTVDLAVKARSTTQTVVSLQGGQVVRGTFEVNGGFSNVDILMRVMSPNNEQLLLSEKKSNYDFVVSGKVGGDYTFIFDNRYSMITPKAIGFYYCIPQPKVPTG